MKKQNANLAKVVQALADGEYHDGTTIGDKLSITRSAVWKTIERLKSYGVAVDAVKGKGYALSEPLILLNARKIKQSAATDVPLEIFESIASTNDYLRGHSSKKPLMVCLAEQQTQGKGRLGRTWQSPFGLNLYFSCLYRFEKDVSELAGLSLVSGLAVAKTLNEFAPGFTVKWPNDVFYQGDKIAGSLIEVQAESHGACYAVIGIGVNANMLQEENITQPFTSLRKITGKMIDRNELCARLLKHLLADLQVFSVSGLSSFMSQWVALDSLTGKTVTLLRANQSIAGNVSGVNAQGHLLLNVDGELQAFSSGDVTVKK